MTSREEVYAALDSERAYQLFRAFQIGDTKEHFHSLEEWTVYIQNYIDELTTSLSRVWRLNSVATTNELDILRKITAMGVAAMEQHGAPRREDF